MWNFLLKLVQRLVIRSRGSYTREQARGVQLGYVTAMPMFQHKYSTLVFVVVVVVVFLFLGVMLISGGFELPCP